jgi:hypothetical protein
VRFRAQSYRFKQQRIKKGQQKWEPIKEIPNSRMLLVFPKTIVVLGLWLFIWTVVKATDQPTSRPTSTPTSRPTSTPTARPTSRPVSSHPTVIPQSIFTSSIKFYYDSSSYQSLYLSDIIPAAQQAVANFVALKFFGCYNYPSTPCPDMAGYASSPAQATTGNAPPTSAPTVFDATAYLPAVALHDQYYFNGSAYFALPGGLGTSLVTSPLTAAKCANLVVIELLHPANSRFLMFLVHLTPFPTLSCDPLICHQGHRPCPPTSLWVVVTDTRNIPTNLAVTI